MSQVIRRYKNNSGVKQLILTEDVIREMIANGENLDMTGLDDHAEFFILLSPLTYCIEKNNKELFLELIHAGADINYRLDICNWTAINSVFETPDSFFLDELVKTGQLDHSLKVNDKNPIEKILGKQSHDFNVVNEKIFFNKIKSYVHSVYNAGVSYEDFFSDPGGAFAGTYYDKKKYLAILDGFPKEWVKKSLNSLSVWGDPIPMAIGVADFLENKPQKLKKIASLVEIAKIWPSGNTILHDYIYRGYTKKDKDSFPLVASFVIDLLEKGADPKIKGKNKKSPEEYLFNTDFYKPYLIQKSYEKLCVEVKNKENTQIRKVKI